MEKKHRGFAGIFAVCLKFRDFYEFLEKFTFFEENFLKNQFYGVSQQFWVNFSGFRKVSSHLGPWMDTV